MQKSNKIATIRDLTEVELGAVAGGMDCKTGLALASIYILAAKFQQAAGESAAAAASAGKANGLIDGAGN